MAWDNLQRAQESDEAPNLGVEVNYVVDDEIRQGNLRSGRARVIGLRERVEAAIDAGEVEDDTIDCCLGFLNDVRRLRTELEKDAPKFQEAELVREAARDYSELAKLLEELLAFMVTDSLAALTSGLNAVEEKVQEIDKKLADEPTISASA